jgi:hypothetical protein
MRLTPGRILLPSPSIHAFALLVIWQSLAVFYLLLGTHCATSMSAFESTPLLAHSGPQPRSSTEANRSLDEARIRPEVHVLSDDFPTTGEPDTSRAKPEQPSCSCPTSGRNLVVCIDGTANQFSEKVSALYSPSYRRALMLSRIPMSSSFTVGSLKTIRSSRTTTAGLEPTSESPSVLFIIGSKLLITLWIWPLHGTHNI